MSRRTTRSPGRTGSEGPGEGVASRCAPRGPQDLAPAVLGAFHGPLLQWYRANKRDLPWRRREDDPYSVWVSEVMLQQTQVATVIPYYERWMARFPTVEALADAPLEEALRYWAGLGYYARARNLHHAARIVVERFSDRIPDDPDALGSLPGVGRYTRGAILSIAFNRPVPILDANVIRVLTRVFAIGRDPKSSANQARLWQIADDLIPAGDARDFNQATMELGALLCTPADPACEHCPLLSVCVAGNSADPTAWPEIPRGRATVRVIHASVVLREGDHVLVVRRPPHGLWGGLWEFPRRVCEHGEPPEECARRAAQEVVGVEARIGPRIGTVKHSVTHHAIALHGFEATITEGTPAPVDCAEVRWVEWQKVDALPRSVPQKALAELLGGSPGSEPAEARDVCESHTPCAGNRT